ncbi:superoxide dismutase [Mycobacterium sp. ACS1612]|uniref:superoxide dismutase family protein n=1 Tax=Mycobacterium sp. ACS1612 TaxID=1834117 RepID=UPI0007FE0F96|nr:superoxide dismutase family protein [Mycobacterium sp. ACS1612]OBF28303.1 superoxide dismutase [Mycobacterium sp. ACS1612]
MFKLVAAVAVLAAVASGCANQSNDNPATGTTTPSGPTAQSLTTQLNTADGKHVANATVDFTSGYATVTVETVATGAMSPGFHGVHIHAVGKCEGDFTSAGEHFQAPGHTGQPASGDLPPLLIRSDGAGKLVATSDAFTADQLKGPEGSAIVLHQGADISGTASDQRIACGVLSPATTAGTSVSTSISTSTVTTSVVAPVPPATVTETTSPTPATTTESPSPSTSTSTVTVTQTTSTTTAPPGG